MSRYGLKLREQAREHGVANAFAALRENVREKRINLATDISLREMAQSFMGDDWHEKLKAYNASAAGQYAIASGGGVAGHGLVLRETGVAVDASAFSAITGQLLIDTIREKYEHATKIGDEIFTTRPITNGNLTTQREPGLMRVKHDPAPLNQAQPYPMTSFDPQYVDYPAPEKYGEICALTFEMIFSDLTAQAVESAESVGEITGLWVEYKKLAVFLGLVNNFSWNGTSYNTYQATAPWVNKVTSYALTDWRSVNTVEQLFAQMIDPATGKPIRIQPKDLFVMPTAVYTARRILNATEVRDQPSLGATATEMLTANPISTNYRVLTSPHARNIAINGFGVIGQGGIASGSYSASNADLITIWGDFKRAFLWRQVYPPKFVQAPPQNPLEFEQDIVMAVKSSVFGVACVRDPRYVAYAGNT
jgi:hypothetical protein